MNFEFIPFKTVFILRSLSSNGDSSFQMPSPRESDEAGNGHVPWQKGRGDCWAEVGRVERKHCWDPLLKALGQRHFPLHVGCGKEFIRAWGSRGRALAGLLVAWRRHVLWRGRAHFPRLGQSLEENVSQGHLRDWNSHQRA